MGRSRDRCARRYRLLPPLLSAPARRTQQRPSLPVACTRGLGDCGRSGTRTQAGVTPYTVSNRAPRPTGHLPGPPRHESNVDRRFRKPLRYPLRHEEMEPKTGIEPAASALPRQRTSECASTAWWTGHGRRCGCPGRTLDPIPIGASVLSLGARPTASSPRVERGTRPSEGQGQSPLLRRSECRGSPLRPPHTCRASTCASQFGRAQ